MTGARPFWRLELDVAAPELSGRPEAGQGAAEDKPSLAAFSTLALERLQWAHRRFAQQPPFISALSAVTDTLASKTEQSCRAFADLGFTPDTGT